MTTKATRMFRLVLIVLPLVLAGWVGVMAMVMLVSDAAPAAVAILPGQGFAQALPADAAILSRGRFHVTVDSDTAGLGRRLYAAGALLVLPAGLTGCLPLPR